MTDHDLIAEHATGLLLRLSDPTKPVRGLFADLRQLGCLITKHGLAQDQIVTAIDPDRLGGPWGLAWDEAQAHRARFKVDWELFIAQWSLQAIDQDRHGFELAARVMLDRIAGGLRIDAEGFYAVALQTGIIGLR